MLLVGFGQLRFGEKGVSTGQVLQDVGVGPVGRSGHADLAGPVGARVGNHIEVTDLCGLGRGRRCRQFGVQQAAITGESAAPPCRGYFDAAGDRAGQGE